MANGVTNKDLYEAIEGLRNDMEKHYVRQEKFEPVQRIVYGLVSLIMVSVVGAILALIMKAPQ